MYSGERLWTTAEMVFHISIWEANSSVLTIPCHFQPTVENLERPWKWVASLDNDLVLMKNPHTGNFKKQIDRDQTTNGIT